MPNRHQRRSVRHGASEASSVGQAGSGFTQFVRARPLLVVAAGIGLGMALGALLPWRLIEDELLGEQAERLKDGALEIASEGYKKAKSVAQGAYNTATEILGGEISTGAGESVSPGQLAENETSGTAPYRN